MEFIPVSEPAFIGNEKQYVLDCMETGWVSSIGKYISLFEEKLAEFFDVKHAIACCNGTVALHLAIEALGIGEGDEVIVPTLTFVASANAICYANATPVFVDIDRESWLIDIAAVEAAITPRTKAIMPVHIFGHPAPMDELRILAEKHNLYIIEDAAEAHGALYNNRKVGGIGHIGCLSFFGNKIITTGEGGAVLTNDDKLAEKMRLLKGQGQDPKRRYWFIEMGYNYRMTNIQAAIGLGQLENIELHTKRRLEIAQWYKELFNAKLPSLQQQTVQPWAHHAYWLNSFVLPADFPLGRDETMIALKQHNVDSRPFFYPMHNLPFYQKEVPLVLKNAEEISSRGISLPTFYHLTREQVEHIVDTLVSLSR